MTSSDRGRKVSTSICRRRDTASDSWTIRRQAYNRKRRRTASSPPPLIFRYRTPRYTYLGPPRTEAIEAGQSRLILAAALAEADWDKSGGEIAPMGTAPARPHGRGWLGSFPTRQTSAAARTWLRDRGGDYRVHRYARPFTAEEEASGRGRSNQTSSGSSWLPRFWQCVLSLLFLFWLLQPYDLAPAAVNHSDCVPAKASNGSCVVETDDAVRRYVSLPAFGKHETAGGSLPPGASPPARHRPGARSARRSHAASTCSVHPSIPLAER